MSDFFYVTGAISLAIIVSELSGIERALKRIATALEKRL